MPESFKDLAAIHWYLPEALLTLDSRAGPDAWQLQKNRALGVLQGQIVDIVEAQTAIHQAQPAQITHLPGQILMPGLHNAHNHAAMVLFRGMADDLPLHVWLQSHIWPAEARCVSPEFVRVGSRLAIAEMLLSGTTSFSDMYFFPEVTAEVAAQMGIGAQLFAPLIDFANAWADNLDLALDKTLALHRTYRDHERIEIGLGPHAPYTLSDASLSKIAAVAQANSLQVHMHVHETAQEITDSLQAHQQRPLARIAAHGLCGPHFQAVHMTQVDEADIQCLLESGAQVVHCPQSNLKLASGFCPSARLLEAGVPLLLGTDGAASNNDLDLWAEMQTAALLAKGVAQQADVMNTQQALSMACVTPGKHAKNQRGQLRAGYQADMISLQLDQPDALPLHHILSQLVYGRMADKVVNVWVAGQPCVRNKELLTADLEQIRHDAHLWVQKLNKDAL